MRLLARYLLRECLVALGYCFSAFLILWLTLDLLSSLHGMQENKMRGLDVAEYYLFRIPEFLPVALPVALLLALLYCITNHARHNEITAMRAAGIALWRISLPYFGIASVAAIALFVLNEYVAPVTGNIAEDILNRRVSSYKAEDRFLIKGFTFKNSREGRSWFIGVYDQRTAEMKPRVLVDWRLPDGSTQHIDAREGARYTNGCWTFYQVSGWKQYPTASSLQVPLPKADVLAMPEFSETPEQIQSEIDVNQDFTHQTKTRRADVPIAVIVNYLRLHPKPNPAMSSWLYTKLHGRFAGPATCLIVVLLAVPFAAGSSRKNVFVGVAASIVIFFVYYILQQFCFAFGETGRMPAWLGAWLPNLLAAATGLFMIARVR